MPQTLHNPDYFFVYFILMWFGVILLLSYISGWQQLARYYPYQNQTITQKKHFQWANVRGVSYKGCVTIGGNEQGLYLSLLFLFSFGHSSLFIPWSDIKIVKKKYWWLPVLELTIAQTPSIKIMVFKSMEEFFNLFQIKV